MSKNRSFVRALVALAAVVFLVFSGPAAMAMEAPSPTATATAASTGEGAAAPADPGPPASYYASYGLVALAGLTILAIVAGYLFQAPGFRRAQRGQAE